ncbi:MAG: beta-propeller fold lactonase family protein [candidate division WOR-3 bacterium]
MKLLLGLLAVSCLLSALHCQELEKVIWLPDTLVGAGRPVCLAWGEATDLFYAGGEHDAFVVGFEPAAGRRVCRVRTPAPVTALCPDQTGDFLYGACTEADSIVVIDCRANTVVAVMPSGAEPTSLCISPSGQKLYCANRSGSNVTVFDCSTRTRLGAIPVGVRPELLCASPASNKVYCTGRGSGGTLAAIDCSTDSLLALLPLAGVPRAIAWNAADNTVWVAGAGWAEPINCANDSLLGFVHLPGDGHRAICCDSSLNRIYCASYGGVYPDSVVYVIDGPTRQVIGSIIVGLRPHRLATVVGRVAVANRMSDDVSIINTGPDTVIGTLPAGRTVWALTQGAGELVACVARNSQEARVIDARSATIVSTVELACRPHSLCYFPSEDRLFAADWARYGIMTIDATGDTLISFAPTPTIPRLLVADTIHGKLYCAHDAATPVPSGVTVLDAASGIVLAEIPTPNDPTALLWCPEANKMYCANGGTDEYPGFTVTIIDCVSDSVRTTLDVAAVPSALTWCPARGRVYCGFRNAAPWLVAAIDCRTDSIVSRVNAPEALPVSELLYVDKGNKLYCGIEEPDIVCVVSCDSDSLTKTIDPGAEPWSLTWAAPVRRVYLVANPPEDTRLVSIDAEADTVWRSLSLLGYAPVARTAWCSPVSGLVYCGTSEVPAGGGILAYDCQQDTVVGYLSGLPEAASAFTPVPGKNRLYGACASGSALIVLREPTGGAEQPRPPHAQCQMLGPTVVRGSLLLPSTPLPTPCSLLTAHYSLVTTDGRKAMDLQPGENDIRHLASGVYFVRTLGLEPTVVRRIVVLR